MAKKRGLKWLFFSGWNPKDWLGTELLGRQADAVRQLYYSAFGLSKHKKLRVEKLPPDFDGEKAFWKHLQREGIKEADIPKCMKRTRLAVYFFLALAVALLIYAVIIFSSGQILSGMICGTLVFLNLAYAFRESFNLYQLKQRRLGCPLRDWYQDLMGREKKIGEHHD